jgi:alcohol dehydrogenase class IV
MPHDASPGHRDTGIDALTRGGGIDVRFATNAFRMQASHLILGALPCAYEDGSDLESRTAKANAAALAGLAFSKAFVCLDHALAHAVGGRFGIAHGRANAAFLPPGPALQRLAAEKIRARGLLRRLSRAGEKYSRSPERALQAADRPHREERSRRRTWKLDPPDPRRVGPGGVRRRRSLARARRRRGSVARPGRIQ